MENDQLIERVKKVTGRVLGIDPKEIKPGDNFIFDLGAESSQSVELVMAFEAEFDVEMDQEQALAVLSVDDAAQFIGKHL